MWMKKNKCFFFCYRRGLHDRLQIDDPLLRSMRVFSSPFYNNSNVNFSTIQLNWLNKMDLLYSWLKRNQQPNQSLSTARLSSRRNNWRDHRICVFVRLSVPPTKMPYRKWNNWAVGGTPDWIALIGLHHCVCRDEELKWIFLWIALLF